MTIGPTGERGERGATGPPGPPESTHKTFSEAIVDLITPHSVSAVFAIGIACIDTWFCHGALDGWDGVLFGLGVGVMGAQVTVPKR